jgi:hypothetical protein
MNVESKIQSDERSLLKRRGWGEWNGNEWKKRIYGYKESAGGYIQVKQSPKEDRLLVAFTSILRSSTLFVVPLRYPGSHGRVDSDSSCCTQNKGFDCDVFILYVVKVLVMLGARGRKQRADAS